MNQNDPIIVSQRVDKDLHEIMRNNNAKKLLSGAKLEQVSVTFDGVKNFVSLYELLEKNKAEFHNRLALV
jgi:hypothetical protein